MADGSRLIDLEVDSNRAASASGAVSSPEEDSSPTTSSPHKLISDCSDLYDLINFHPSATTQLHCDNDDDVIDEPEVDTFAQKSWSRSDHQQQLQQQQQPKQCFTIVHHRKSKTSSTTPSSSSSEIEEGDDDDSGTYARSNGHNRLLNADVDVDDEYDVTNGGHMDREPAESPESAVESSPEDRAAATTTTTTTATTASSLEGSFSPVDTGELQGDFVVHRQEFEAVTTKRTVTTTTTTTNIVSSPDEPTSDDFDVVALESSLVHANNPTHPISLDVVQCHRDYDLRPESCPSSDASSPLIEHVSAVSDVTNADRQHQPMSMDKWLKEDDDDAVLEIVQSNPQEQQLLADADDDDDDADADDDEDDDGAMLDGEVINDVGDINNHDQGQDLSFAVNKVQDDVDDGNNRNATHETNHQLVQQSQVMSVTQLTSHDVHDDDGDADAKSSQSSSDSDSDVGKNHNQEKRGRKKAGNKKVVTESTTVITSSSTISKTKSGPGVEGGGGRDGGGGGPATDTFSELKKSTTTTTTTTSSNSISSTATSDVDTADNVSDSATNSLHSLDDSDGDVAVEKEAIETGVSIAHLRASFTELQGPNANRPKQQQHQRQKQQQQQQVIDTGVNINILTAHYRGGRVVSNHAASFGSSTKIIAQQRTRSHGDLRDMDESLLNSDADDYDQSAYIPSVLMRAKSYSELSCYEEERLNAKEAIYTGVSVKALKSSFNSSESVHRNHDFDETEGVKIDRAKVTRNFSQMECPLYALLDDTSADEKAVVCRICGKQAFHMERIKAEKSVFHKSCFRCQECSKSLSVDTYCSHEGVLYCRPHFRQLFQPKAKFEEETIIIIYGVIHFTVL